MVWLTKPPLGTQLDWANPLNTGLVGLWIFNEGIGDKVYDLSGNENTGTLTNMAFPSTPTSGWNPGRLGPAIALDGSDDRVNCGNNPIFNITDTITMSAWVMLNQNDNLNPIVTKDLAYILRRTNLAEGKYFQFLVRTGGIWSSKAISIAVATPGVWYHVVGTYNKDGGTNNLNIYVNGVRGTPQTVTGTIDTNTELVNIGFRIVNFFNGLIDESRIWNRVLTNDEILTLYTSPYSMFIDESTCPPIACSLTVE